jgi:DNA transformation protein
MAKRASANPELDALSALARELFDPIAYITVRRMFGGAGVYGDGVMFGLLAFDTIYLKTDSILDADYDAAGDCPRFFYDSGTGKTASMSYRRMPESALDDPHEAADWGRKALGAALRAKAPRRS